MTPIMLRRYLAEFLGTFAYVFFGCGTRIVTWNSPIDISRLLVYFTFGFTLLALTYALSHFSGAPFNPALTFGLALVERFPWRYVLPYWIAQIFGAFAATTAHALLLPDKAAQAMYGATIPTVGIWQAIGIEAIISFFLMLVAMASTTDQRVNRGIFGLAMGAMIALCGWFAGPLTGGSMNPARSLAPAVFAGGIALANVWIYWVGPLIGTSLGALVYEVLRGGTEYGIETPEGIFQGINRSMRSHPSTLDSKESITQSPTDTLQTH